MPIVILTIVAWEALFIEKFAAFAMRTLLSRGNLPALAARAQVRIQLFTDRASCAYFLERTQPLARIAEILPHTFEETRVDARTIADSVASLRGAKLKHEIDRLTQFYSIDAALEAGDDVTLFLINHDLLVADGALTRAHETIEAGAEAVAPPVLRLSLERSGLRAERFLVAPEEAETGLSAEAICRSMPENLHHITRDSIAAGDRFTAYPATVLWPVARQGFLCRTFFPHPFAFRPNARCRRFDSTIDYDFLLRLASSTEAVRVPGNSRELFVCKLTSDGYMADKPVTGRLALGPMAHFILTETNKAHRNLVSQPYRLFAVGPGEEDEDAWAMAERQSADFLDRAYALCDRARSELPADTPGLRVSIASHFGPLDAYLSPGRRGSSPM